MNSKTLRISVVVGLAALASSMAVVHEVSAAEPEHPDFLFTPPSKPAGSRLYVGNLTWDTGSVHEAQFNPKELTVEQSVAWQK